MDAPLCIIAGAGPGNGLALCNRFLDGGYRVAILSRSLENQIKLAAGRDRVFPYACDLGDPENIATVFSAILEERGVPRVVIYNAGKGVFGAPLDTALADFEGAWRLNALGLLAVSQNTVPAMIDNGGGSLLVTSATAAHRGGAAFAAFSAAKGAQRNLAQSLARSLGPQGIHVAMVTIDGIIDSPLARQRFPDRQDAEFLQPATIAESYFALAHQAPSGWSFEMDLRTSRESW